MDFVCDFSFTVYNRGPKKAAEMLMRFLDQMDEQMFYREEHIPGYKVTSSTNWLGNILIEMGYKYALRSSGYYNEIIQFGKDAEELCGHNNINLDGWYTTYDYEREGVLTIFTKCNNYPLDKVWLALFRYLDIINDIEIGYEAYTDTKSLFPSSDACFASSVEYTQCDSYLKGYIDEETYSRLMPAIKSTNPKKCDVKKAAPIDAPFFVTANLYCDKLFDAMKKSQDFPEIHSIPEAYDWFETHHIPLCDMQFGFLFDGVKCAKRAKTSEM